MVDTVKTLGGLDFVAENETDKIIKFEKSLYKVGIIFLFKSHFMFKIILDME